MSDSFVHRDEAMSQEKQPDPTPLCRGEARFPEQLFLSDQGCPCPSCHAKHQAVFSEVVSEEILAAVPHRHVVISLPRRLRPFSRRRKRLTRLAYDTVKDLLWAAAGTHTAVNIECKSLLLAHAFDNLGAVRVQLKTDLLNVRSQRAIERLGAVREGVLRKHIVLWDGFIRDTVYYSFIDSEWPGVKRHLERLLERGVGV